MNYKLDGISITNYGAKPVRTNQAFALHGMFDLPKRISPTEYNWGTSIEPFVEAEDIKLDGRVLTLNVAVNHENVTQFSEACTQSTKISTTHDIYDVVCRDEIEVQNIGNYCLVIAKFWQNNYTLGPTPTDPSVSGSFRLDDYDFKKDFGIYVSKSNNLSNTAKRIEVATTEFYARTNYRGSKDIILNCSMITSSAASLFYNMKRLHALMMAPGLRTLVTPNKTFTVYFKSGLTATAFKENILQFNLTATVV